MVISRCCATQSGAVWRRCGAASWCSSLHCSKIKLKIWKERKYWLWCKTKCERRSVSLVLLVQLYWSPRVVDCCRASWWTCYRHGCYQVPHGAGGAVPRGRRDWRRRETPVSIHVYCLNSIHIILPTPSGIFFSILLVLIKDRNFIKLICIF